MPRRIRSFVLRSGRLTRGQQQAIERYWSQYGLDWPAQPPFFAEKKPLWLEIGFGNGDSLLQMAQAHPERHYIGIEVHRPGIGHCLRRLAELGLSNLKIIAHDAVEVLDHLPANSLQGVQIFFPDPWPKKRHHKRRLIQPDFVRKLHRCLEPQGVVHLATDWQDYAEWMQQVFADQADQWQGGLIERPIDRPLTKFEQRGQRLGHGVWDMKYYKLDTR